jgi:hypothetical protein
LECSGLTELWMGIERVDGKIQSGVKPPQSKKPGSGISREDAKARRKGRRRGSSLTRRVGDRVPQLPMTFCGHEGVLECSGWTELGMARERVDGEIQSGVKPPQSKKPASGISREAAKARRKGRRRFSVSSLAHVVQLPKTFCGHEGVLECSGLTEIGLGRIRGFGKAWIGARVIIGIRSPRWGAGGLGAAAEIDFVRTERRCAGPPCSPACG